MYNFRRPNSCRVLQGQTYPRTFHPRNIQSTILIDPAPSVWDKRKQFLYISAQVIGVRRHHLFLVTSNRIYGRLGRILNSNRMVSYN